MQASLVADNPRVRPNTTLVVHCCHDVVFVVYRTSTSTSRQDCAATTLLLRRRRRRRLLLLLLLLELRGGDLEPILRSRLARLARNLANLGRQHLGRGGRVTSHLANLGHLDGNHWHHLWGIVGEQGGGGQGVGGHSCPRPRSAGLARWARLLQD